MGSKLLGVMTGVALLASIGVASAGQRVILTDAQLDRVVAGDASVTAEVFHANAGVTFALFDTAARSSASISATFTPNGAAPNQVLLAASASVP
jgi:H2-forming N5,N10-methylenetetrahydromethanopterin dehydrogenase-like enzyme